MFADLCIRNMYLLLKEALLNEKSPTELDCKLESNENKLVGATSNGISDDSSALYSRSDDSTMALNLSLEESEVDENQNQSQFQGQKSDYRSGSSMRSMSMTNQHNAASSHSPPSSGMSSCGLPNFATQVNNFFFCIL